MTAANPNPHDPANPELEQELTDIWRPLFDDRIHAQGMAYLIRACKDESMALITQREARAYERGWRDERDLSYQKGLDSKAPMGVSQWREHGRKYGYWDYFVKELEKGKPE